MDAAYLHIVINHFPIVLSLLGLAAAVASFVWRRRAVWLYAVATLTLAGLSAYPAVFTGHGAEESMEDMNYVRREAIHDHEEAADLAMWVLLATGAVSAYAWWRALRAAPRDASLDTPGWLRGLVVVGALASAGTVSWAAKKSDPILHYTPLLQHPPAPGIPATPPGTMPPAFPERPPRPDRPEGAPTS
jgi:hypothetical protein